MPAVNYKTIEELTCEHRAMEQWERSLKRPDLSEEDRVLGAIEAYQRQAFVFSGLATKGIYRHKKRGTVYEIISFGKLQASRWFQEIESNNGTGLGSGGNIAYAPVDMIDVVIYRNVEDEEEVWVRPKSEFYDGRFEAVED